MFTAHITFSIGWLGAVVAYLALAVVGFSTQEDDLIRSVYPSLELIGWYVVVPFCFADVAGLNRSSSCDKIWAKKGPDHGKKEICT